MGTFSFEALRILGQVRCFRRILLRRFLPFAAVVLPLPTAVRAAAESSEIETNVVGIVTAISPHERIVYLRADDGSAWRGDFWYSTFPHNLARGDRLSMRGRFRVKGDPRPRLVDAAPVSIEKGAAAPPEAEKTSLAELCSHPSMRAGARDWWGVRIATAGRIVDINRRDMWAQILLKEEGGAHLQAFFLKPYDQPLDVDFQIGAEVRVTGIALYSPEQDEIDGHVVRINNPLVYVENPDDFDFVNPAPWWTAQRLAIALAIVLAILAVVSSWAVLQRRKRLEERRISDALGRERLRLAGELHDNFQQLLAGCVFRLGAAEQLTNPDDTAVLSELAKLGALLNHAQNDLRAALWGMREEAEGPTAISALLKYAADRMPHWQGKVFFKTVGEERALTRRYSGLLLLILQESIANALKHGRAQRIDVTIVFAKRFSELSVKDDGIGFDAAGYSADNAYGLGILSMRNRVESVGGGFRIVSSPGCGTEVKVKVRNV